MAASVLERFYMIEGGFFTFNLKYLFFVGLWPKKDLTKNQKIAYKIYEIILHVLTVTFLVLTGIGTYQHKDDITIFLSNIDKSLVGYNLLFKSIAFCFERDRLRDLIDAIEMSGEDATDERKKIMAKYVIILTGYTAAMIIAFNLLAVLEGKMVIEAWMPIDPTESLMNLMTCSQILALIIIPGLCRSFAMQGIVCSMLMYLCDQLINLQNELRSLEYSKEFDKLLRIQFKKIIEKHIRLMGYSTAMENVFRKYFLIQNTAITLELCLNAVMMTAVGVKEKSLITFLSYLLFTLINSYIYCYLGNELITQSEGIAFAAYETNWTTWPLDLQKSLLIMIIAAQRPFKLSAGGIAWLSIQTFSQTLQNAYTIFAVLNDVVT